MSEQRLFLRKKVPLPVPIELLPGKEMWLHDIGEGGLSVSGSSRLEPGTATFFSFQFPDANSMIEASGVVAWCDGGGRVGIRFTRIKPDSSAVLKRWLKSDERQSSAGTEQAAAEPHRAGIEGDTAALRQEISRAGLASSAVLDFIVHRMKDRTRASGAAIALRDTDSVICRATSGNAPPVGTSLNTDNTVTGECYRTGNIVSITDSEKDARVNAELCRQLGFRSLLIVPIAAGEDVVGILEVFSPVAGNFEGGDVLLLGSMAEVAAEIYGAQQRKTSVPSPIAAQPIPLFVSELVEQVPQTVNTVTEIKQGADRSAEGCVQNCAVPSADDPIVAGNEICSETPAAGSSLSSSAADHSGDEQNEEDKNYWKPRNYLLLMAGLTILGLGTGGIADWHMTSRLASSFAQPAAAADAESATSVAIPDAKLLAIGNASPSPAVDTPAKVRIPATSLPPKKAIGGKLEKSSLALKSTTQKESPESQAYVSRNTASLTPSEAVLLAGSFPHLDPRITAQLTPAKLLHRVDPVVPDFAESAGMHGTVLLSAMIGTDGKLREVRFVSGDRALAIEAFRAVREWRYRPYMLNGKPIEAETRIIMNFHP